MAVTPASHLTAALPQIHLRPQAGRSPRVAGAEPLTCLEPPASDAQEPVQEIRHSRRHIQQTLRHLERVVRHALKDSLKAADDLDQRSVKEIRGLSQQYRHDLREVFLNAGRGNSFDPASILEGLAAATRTFTESLRALRDDPADEQTVLPVEDPAEPIAPAPEHAPQISSGFSGYA